ncbi:hypothetical protein [Kitasatospora acidiphila]|uniref:hypothetical protein n=1 Tax=Kitasatospora acidiphila TaxID=2567942 RepID=UPI003C734826
MIHQISESAGGGHVPPAGGDQASLHSRHADCGDRIGVTLQLGSAIVLLGGRRAGHTGGKDSGHDGDQRQVPSAGPAAPPW